jgi:CRP-like cAMP-binding protein/HEAT repeat protein
VKVYTINNLLNIRAAEWPRLLLLYSMLFLFFLGLIWGDIALEAAFLTEVGARSLAWFFILRAVMAIPAVALYTAFADRVPNDRLLTVLLGVSIAALLGGLALLGQGYTMPAYLLMYLLVPFTELTIFTTHWYTYVNGFYDTQEAKRIVPVLGTATAIAAIVAGQTMPLLQETLAFSTAQIVLVWIGTLIGVGVLARLLPLLLREQPTLPAATAPRASYHEHVREGYRYVASSGFLRWMALSMMLLLVLFTLLQFQAGRIFEASFARTEDLAIFLGRVVSIANMLLLPVQLLLLSRIIGSIGLGTTHMIYPLGALVVCCGLALAAAVPAIALPMAALAYFTRTDFHGSFGYAVSSLLYNAVPPHVKGRARAFIGGLVVPCGLLVGGLLLLLPLVGQAWFVPALLVLAGAAYAASAAMVRRSYRRALIGLLEQDDMSFLTHHEPARFSAADPVTLEALRQRLEQSTSYDSIVFHAQLLSTSGGSEAAPLLEQAAHHAPDARTRAAILHALTAAEAPGGVALRVCAEFLGDPDSQVRLAAVCGIEHLAATYGATLRPLLLPALRDTDPEIAAHALLALVHTGPLDDLPPALQLLDSLLTHAVPTHRAQGARVLGQIGDAPALRRLLPLLHDPADDVRLAAALALEQADAAVLPTTIAAQADALVADPVERIRCAALVLLERSAGPAAYPVLVHALADPGPTVRETAVTVLLRRGHPVLPTVQQALEATNPHMRKMAALVLSQLDPARFAPLLNVYILTNIEAITLSHNLRAALAPGAAAPGIALLRRTLAAQVAHLRTEIVSFLTAHDPDAPIERLIDALRSTDDQRRASAAEVLETLTSPQLVRLLVPLFNEQSPPDEHHSAARPLDMRAALRYLLSETDNAWWRAATALVLAELGNGASAAPLARAEMRALLTTASSDPSDDVRTAAHVALRMLAGEATSAGWQTNGSSETAAYPHQEEPVLSPIERMMFLKEVPVFHEMTIDQLRVVASACEEVRFAAGETIIRAGEPGGALYIIVQGQVEIAYTAAEVLPDDAPVHLATLGAHAYLGEMSLFDNQPTSASALALEETLTLKLHREPVLALCRHSPDLSLALIHALSQRLREANQRISELSHEHPIPTLTGV